MVGTGKVGRRDSLAGGLAGGRVARWAPGPGPRLAVNEACTHMTPAGRAGSRSGSARMRWCADGKTDLAVVGYR